MKLRESIVRTLPILGHANFLKLWGSQIMNQSAGHILNFALAVRIYEVSHSSTLVGVLVATVSVPPILFSSLAGALADRFDRKTILFLSNVLRAFVVIAFFLWGNSPFAMIVLGFIISAISQFFGPAESSTIPEVVSRSELFVANSIFVSTVYITFLIGYSVAGPLLQTFGATKMYAILFFAFLLSAALNAFMPKLTTHLERTIRLNEFFRSLRGEIKEGISFIKSKPLVLTLLIQFSLVFGFERSIISLIPALATNVFGFNTQQMSLCLIMPAGIGAAIGALVGNIVKRKWKKSTLIVTGIVSAGMTLCLIPLVQSIGNPDLAVIHDMVRLWYIMALVFLTGLADVLIIVAAQTTFHEETPGHTRGRVFGTLITMMNLIGLPMILLVSKAGEVFDLLDVIFVTGVLLVLLGIYSAFKDRRLNGHSL